MSGRPGQRTTSQGRGSGSDEGVVTSALTVTPTSDWLA